MSQSWTGGSSCMYICTYIQNVHMYIHTKRTYVYTYKTYICTYIQNVHMYIYTKCTYVHTYKTYICTYIQKYICTYIQNVHMYIHTKRTYVHTYKTYICTYIQNVHMYPMFQCKYKSCPSQLEESEIWLFYYLEHFGRLVASLVSGKEFWETRDG
jgi:hypothetical protein